jgi:hypothetical protein
LTSEQVEGLVDQLVGPLGEAMAPAFQQTAEAVKSLEQRLAGTQSQQAVQGTGNDADAAQARFTEFYQDPNKFIASAIKEPVAEMLKEELGPVMRGMLGSQVDSNTAEQRSRVVEEYGEDGWKALEPLASDTLGKMTPAQLADKNTVRAAVNACIAQDEVADAMRKHWTERQAVKQAEREALAVPGAGITRSPADQEKLTPEQKDFVEEVGMDPKAYLGSLKGGRTLDDYLKRNPDRAKEFQGGSR